MAKEKRFFPMGCDAIAGELHVRVDQLYQRHATLVARMDELERTTRARYEQCTSALPELISQQEELLRKAEEQEEESNRIFANQNELLNSLNMTLTDIHTRLHLLADRQEELMRRMAVSGHSE
ncbi:MAG: hypothetical protein G8237_07295 [Magnetococcales bacterium]|nr:hypothetical protein [Magnetococcales bacterium]